MLLQVPAVSRPRRGFTLIELLVVISIIALLISILLPALKRARSAARAIQCMSNLRMMGVANNMYADDYDGVYVPVRATGLPDRWFSGYDFYQYAGLSIYGSKFPGNVVSTLTWRPLFCPDAPGATTGKWMGFAYGMPDFALDVVFTSGSTNHYGNVRKKVVKPSRRMMILDGLASNIFASHWNNYYPEPHGWSDANTSLHPPAYRHADAANLLYFDNHVAGVKKEGLDPSIPRTISPWGAMDP